MQFHPPVRSSALRPRAIFDRHWPLDPLHTHTRPSAAMGKAAKGKPAASGPKDLTMQVLGSTKTREQVRCGPEAKNTAFHPPHDFGPKSMCAV